MDKTAAETEHKYKIDGIVVNGQLCVVIHDLLVFLYEARDDVSDERAKQILGWLIDIFSRKQE